MACRGKSLGYFDLQYLLFVTYFFIYTPPKSNGGFQTAGNSGGLQTVGNQLATLDLSGKKQTGGNTLNGG